MNHNQQSINAVMRKFNINQHDALCYLTDTHRGRLTDTWLDISRRNNFYNNLNRYHMQVNKRPPQPERSQLQTYEYVATPL